MHRTGKGFESTIPKNNKSGGVKTKNNYLAGLFFFFNPISKIFLFRKQSPI